MSDVFARVGGTNGNNGNLTAWNMIEVDNGNVVIDDTWLWRADHGTDGQVKNS